MTSRRRRHTRRLRAGGSRVPLRAVAEHHAFALLATLGRLTRDPLGTLLTVAVIAIAIALPTALYLGLKNVQEISEGWQQVNEMTVLLDPSASESDAQRVASELDASATVADVSVVAPEEALRSLEAQGEFGEALGALDENPLPWAVVATPVPGTAAEAIEQLATQAQGLPGVAVAQFDMAWLIRFNSMVDAAQRLVRLIAALLTLGVLLIVGNTIRLDIENRREEIEITKMLGGTDGFVRRPFLYTGAWLGLTGGAAALALVLAAMVALMPSAQALAEAYGSDAGLAGPDLAEAGLVIGGAALVGWLGAWIAVARHLNSIQPGTQ